MSNLRISLHKPSAMPFALSNVYLLATVFCRAVPSIKDVALLKLVSHMVSPEEVRICA